LDREICVRRGVQRTTQVNGTRSTRNTYPESLVQLGEGLGLVLQHDGERNVRERVGGALRLPVRRGCD
jgi:hypothetical protein